MKRERPAVATRPAASTPQEPRADTRQAVQVLRWAWAGYMFLPAMAMLLLALTLATVPLSGDAGSFLRFSMAVLVFGLPAVQILLAMRFSVPEPDGHRVVAEDAPELFEAIEQARGKLGAPSIEAVYIDQSFNAGALERPLRGIFGGWQRELIIGLPMMFALSPKELTGVIGHELGHFAGAHGRRHRQVMRTQVAWAQTMQRLEGMPLAGLTFQLLAHVGNWYVPRLMRMASALSRADEFEADRAEAEVVGTRTAGEAHVRIQVASKFLKCIVEEFHAANVTGEPPDMRLFALMAETLPSAVSWPDAKNALDVALTEKTEAFDDHPCVAGRLAALGCPARLPWDLKEDAASLLGDDLRARLIIGFDDMWWGDMAETWVEQGVRNERLARLEDAASENCGPMRRLMDEAAGEADMDGREEPRAAVA